MSPINERSAEFYRGCLHAVQGMPCATQYYTALLAAAEAREATQPSAEEVIEAAEKALESWSNAMNKHGEWDDGCFYYAKTSASELEPRIERNAAALALCARWKEANGGK